MTYTSPAGWVEPLKSTKEQGYSGRETFHLREDCPRVRAPELLKRVERPWSAVRCPRCAQL